MLDLGFNKIVAVVEVKIDAPQFPGRALMKFANDLSLIEVLIKRLKASTLLDDIVLTYPWDASNTPLNHIAMNAGVHTLRGKEDDVLDRVYRAAVSRKAGIVAHIRDNSPLIDPFVVDRCISAIKQFSNFDYVVAQDLPEGTYPEVMSLDALEKAWEQAEEPADRSTVTGFLKANPAHFKQYTLQWEPANWAFSRVTVDNENDFRLVNSLIARFRECTQLGLNDLKR